ncbi:hypothetical protein OSB04_002754 [Centaurea solstitialis]|uniref:Zinc finger, CCHC-type n=1 Tax=Centaurea solstitialis TaxID=347529 RepID=A0AA38TTH3_9ASTR|nr:hypothetical protein OSB04_002754 [Centaurea solstitialis]
MAENAETLTIREQGNVLLQCPKLTEMNYILWSIKVETMLRLGHESHYLQTARGDILLTVSKHKDAKVVWEAILVQYLVVDQVQKELEMLRMKENQTINEFSGKISGIVAKFKSLGSSLEEEVVMRKLLNLAPKKYLPIISSIEQYSEIEIMSFEEAVGRLKAHGKAMMKRMKNKDNFC